mmetsp:Transcript_9633/g.24936  ORF Transcript_9633/g.24936 Transcript_9633/m.24936 type:complete len:288 (-) Transcript_9633:96-959(-)|eukprot:CAMPEP_0119409616 /NCGR_PEP_ID=MMETSP1335-20130426/2865_1 /TAXON_ID=259385 /ORGANISM="Chrysoculter rhomboideus, Strain RCC1486" /LENGTH=287 /DNA_ID=CAMNT_0007434017 /DNA_START=6 /DNA_END=869 /DNA_ORIENTATION=+
MDCPPSAPFDAWDPILQRFARKNGDHPPELRSGHVAVDWSVPQSELIAKVRALSPPALATLRVSGTPGMPDSTPTSSTTPASSLGPLTDGQASSSGRHSTGACGPVEQRRSTGSGSRTRSRASDPADVSAGQLDDGSEVLDERAAAAAAHDEEAGAGMDVAAVAGASQVESEEEASRRLAMQLYQEEQAAFMQEYATRLTSPDNPARRVSDGLMHATPAGAGSTTQGDASRAPMDVEVDEMDESLQLAWQLQQEELQYSAYRVRPAHGETLDDDADVSPHSGPGTHS